MTGQTATVVQAYRFALDPTPRQARMLASHVGAARFVFNRMLAEVKADLDRYHAGEPTLVEGWSLAALRRTWNAHKNDWAVSADTGKAWWPVNSKEAYSSGLAGLADALKGWRAGRTRFPRFRKRHRPMGVRFTTGAIRCEPDRKHVTLPRIGRVKAHESTRKLARRIERGTARILAATVSQDAAGRWHVAFTCEVQRTIGRPAHQPRKAEAVGVDVGVHRLATLARSDGTVEHVDNPRALEAAGKRLGRLQRKAARQQAGSRRRQRTSRRIGRTHRRVADVRGDALTKLATSLAQQHDVVAVETLNADGMRRRKAGMGKAGRAINRALADAALGELRRQLAYKTRWYGSRLVEADRWYPSSKKCSACGAVKAKLSLADRVYECDACGVAVDRDANAARNLLQLAERELVARSTGSRPETPSPQWAGNGQGAERETEAAPAADAAGDELSTPHGPEPDKTGTASPQGEAA